MGVYICTYVSL